MSDVIQCDNCGAVLLAEDQFCGECGAPRPTLISPTEPGAIRPIPQEPVPRPSVSLPSAAPSQPGSITPRTRFWQITVIALSLLSVMLCGLGLAVFLLVGFADSNVASPEENWLFSTLCCLVPIAGSGCLMGLVALGIWLARIRKR